MPTTRYTLSSNTTWTNIGTAPCFVQNVGSQPVAFVIDTTLPASAAADAHVLTRGGTAGDSADIGLTGQNVYVRPYTLSTVAVSR